MTIAPARRVDETGTGTNTATNIRSRLVSSLSLRPSIEWLDACISYLRNKPKIVNADTVLFQVLYSDLRDVVRERALSVGVNINIFPPAMQLREGIRYSSLVAHDYKHTLPNTFVLLCQLEELSDVSMSAGKRLESSDNNKNNDQLNNNRSGNYHQPRPSRCLKLCMSDGYDCSEINNNNHSNVMSSNIVGIETTAIPNLFVHSLAGLKVLLKGPIIIRHQILLLNPANCVIIGGCIEDLVRQQGEALKKAKRSAGVGVDATIRALIRTTGLDEDDGNGIDDEAHEASGDVIPRQQQQHLENRRVLPVQPPLRQQQQQSQPSSSFHNNSNNNNSNPYPGAVGRIQTVSQSQTTSRHIFRTDTSARSTLTPTNNTNTRLASSSSSSATPLINTASSSLSIGTRTGPINPYNRGGKSTSSANNSTNTVSRRINAIANPYNRLPQRQQTMIPVVATANINERVVKAATQNSAMQTNNPYNRGKTSIVETSIAETSTSRQEMTTTMRKQVVAGSKIHRNNEGLPSSVAKSFEGTGRSTQLTTATVTPSSTNNDTQSKAVASSTTNASNALVQNMPYATLYPLLLKLVDDRVMYESQQNMVFRVKVAALNPYFNIVKSKKDIKTKKNKKYEFFLSASFKSADTDDDDSSNSSSNNNNDSLLLSCRIHPSLLDAHFDSSPHELRALSRTNRDECTRLMHEASQKVVKAYFSPRFWRATLNFTAEELFGEGSSISLKTVTERLTDLETPILLLRPDHQ